MEISIVFPHQLFQFNPALVKGRTVLLVEEYLYFQQYAFHQQKLILHRASMQFYQQFLVDSGYHVVYKAAEGKAIKTKELIAELHTKGYTHIHYVDVVDNWLQKLIESTCTKLQMQTTVYESPQFMNNLENVTSFFNSRKTYFQTDFYIWQRKQKQILISEDQKPLGGKWTFDAENRSSFPKGEVIPHYSFPSHNKWVIEAKQYVIKYYAHNLGSSTEFFTENTFYPTTFLESKIWLQSFLKERFTKFGIYEDSMVANEPILYHSVLTPMLNIGLITPKEVVDSALDYAQKNDAPINSVEGFIRQIIGWREFIRIV
ncbi:MAG: cryptochrome/photolyase family protein [Chitinophagaceae bacterium]